MSTDGPGENPVKRAEEMCSMAQCMIDITSKHLFGLRSQTTTDLIQQEICESESKLIKLISKQLVAKAKLKVDEVPEKLQEYPKTAQWLSIVGIQDRAKKGIMERGITLESLLEMSEAEVVRLMDRYHAVPEDSNKLNSALKNLKVWTELQLEGDVTQSTDLELHWSTYKSASSSPYGGSSPKFGHHPRTSTSSLPPEAMLATSPLSPAAPPSPPQSTPTSPTPIHDRHHRYTPPPTPPLVKPSSKGKFPTTPPPQKKNKLHPDTFLPPLTKSKSHESQLSQKVNPLKEVSSASFLSTNPKKPANLSLTSSIEAISSARKKSADGGEALQISPLTIASSPKRSPPHKHNIDHPVTPPDVLADVHPNKKNQLMVPVSPMAPLTGGPKHLKHSIQHRFTNTFKITQCDYCQKHMFLGYRCKDCKFQTKLVVSSCDACRRQVILGKVCKTCKFITKLIVGACDYCHKHIFRGKYCKYCKSKFHRECASRAAPSCGLSNELVDIVVQSISNSPHMRRSVNHTMSLPMGEGSMEHAHSMPMFHPGMGGHGPDSSSNTSSCNSSTPSSPALLMATPTPPSPTPSPAIHITPDTQFNFDVDNSSLVNTMDTIGSLGSYSDLDNSNLQGDQSYICEVINTNTSNDSDKSDKTLVDTGSSSERTNSGVLERVDSMESTEDGITNPWQRVNSISVTLKEWDIPYEELEVEPEIGTGRFGTVHKGNWHGVIAIKMLKIDPDTDFQAQLQAFKLEIAMLRKTRHENLVLFMGACMKHPHLAIVTSLCKGPTLYTYIHVRKEKFAMNRAVIIASQIAQGMGYLHAKAIVHKDLKTKNIFLENGKVVITDFGLFSLTKLCSGSRKGEWLSIPPGWLCYLAPEIMRSLRASNAHQHDLPFSAATDVYAFGTVWYELLCGEWPFRNQPPEPIIWQVGKGIKQSLGNIQASRDVKDVLMLCWSYPPDSRPDFTALLKTLERLPKKRLARSPSHPIQLSRSAESVF